MSKTHRGTGDRFGGKTIIIDQNIYSKPLRSYLAEEGFSTMIVVDNTTDAAIIAKAKEMDAIVLTNNAKDFTNKGVNLLKASDNMKKQPIRVVDLIKKTEENVNSGKTDLKAPKGVSLANQ